MAVSGGYAPWVMLRALADEDVPWLSVHRTGPQGQLRSLSMKYFVPEMSALAISPLASSW